MCRLDGCRFLSQINKKELTDELLRDDPTHILAHVRNERCILHTASDLQLIVLPNDHKVRSHAGFMDTVFLSKLGTLTTTNSRSTANNSSTVLRERYYNLANRRFQSTVPETTATANSEGCRTPTSKAPSGATLTSLQTHLLWREMEHLFLSSAVVPHFQPVRGRNSCQTSRLELDTINFRLKRENHSSSKHLACHLTSIESALVGDASAAENRASSRRSFFVMPAATGTTLPPYVAGREAASIKSAATLRQTYMPKY